MRRLLLAMLLVPSLGLAAQENTAAPSEKTAAPSDNPWAAWVQPKITNEAKDKQEIQALFKAMETAGKKGDIDAAVALVDFPVMMMTDDSKGLGKGEAWTREQWVEVMKPFYDHPMKATKVTHKPSIFLLSDSLATVNDICTVTTGGKTVTTRNSMFVIRRDGRWFLKAMAEGGWGDMPSPAAQGTASGEPGAASQGTGSAAEAPGTQGTGSGAEAPGSQGTGSGGAPAPAEGTTK